MDESLKAMRELLDKMKDIMAEARYQLAVLRDGRLTHDELIAKLDVYEWRDHR